MGLLCSLIVNKPNMLKYSFNPLYWFLLENIFRMVELKGDLDSNPNIVDIQMVLTS